MIKETVFKFTGNELKQLRKSKGLEQKELAAKMAVFNWTRYTVKNFERLKENQFIISQAAGELLASILNVSSI